MNLARGKCAIRGVGLLIAIGGVALAPSVAQAAVTGALAQLATPNNCIQPGTTGTECGTNGTGVSGAFDVATSPDGKNVYVAGRNNSAIAEFARNSDGSLTQLARPNDCIAEKGTNLCGNATADGLGDVTKLVVSPDGKNVYAIGNFSIVEFSRSSDGSLSQLASPNNCIQENAQASPCGTTAHGLRNPSGLTVSPDGKNVYVADYGSGNGEQGAVTEFSRDPATGALTQLASPNDCIEEAPGTDECGSTGKGLSNAGVVMVSSDGKNVYTAGFHSPGAIAEFVRDPVTGALTQLPGPNNCIEAVGGSDCGTSTGVGIDLVTGVAGSPDGHNVYTAAFGSGGGVAEFGRDAITGALTQLSGPNNCIEEHDTSPSLGCGTQTGHGLGNDFDLKVSPDGQSVYVTGSSQNALVELARNSDGSLTQLASPNDCIQENGGSDCGTTSGRGLANTQALTISPDSANVYVASAGFQQPVSEAVGIRPLAVVQRPPSAVAEFSRVTPPAPPSSGSPPPGAPATGSAPPKQAVKAVKKAKKKRHHKKKHRVKAKRVARRRPSFTG